MAIGEMQIAQQSLLEQLNAEQQMRAHTRSGVYAIRKWINIISDGASVFENNEGISSTYKFGGKVYR